MLNFKHKQSGVVRNVTKAIAFSSYFMSSSALANQGTEPAEPPELNVSAFKAPVSPNGARQSSSVRAGLNGRAVTPLAGKLTFEWKVDSKLIEKCFFANESGLIEQGGFLYDNKVPKEEKAAHGTFVSVVGGCRVILGKLGIAASAQFIGSNLRMYGKDETKIIDAPFTWAKLPLLNITLGGAKEHPHSAFELMSGRVTLDPELTTFHANLLFAGVREIGHSHLLYTISPFYNKVDSQDVLGVLSSAMLWREIGKQIQVGAGLEASGSVNIPHQAIVLEGLGKVCLSLPFNKLGVGVCGAGGYAGVLEYGQYHPDKEPNAPLGRFTGILKW